MGATTERLRAAADAAGVPWRAGLVEGSPERRVDLGTATALGPTDAESLTLTEDGDGNLWCEDALSVRQALALAHVGGGDDE